MKVMAETLGTRARKLDPAEEAVKDPTYLLIINSQSTTLRTTTLRRPLSPRLPRLHPAISHPAGNPAGLCAAVAAFPTHPPPHTAVARPTTATARRHRCSPPAARRLRPLYLFVFQRPVGRRRAVPWAVGRAVAVGLSPSTATRWPRRVASAAPCRVGRSVSRCFLVRACLLRARFHPSPGFVLSHLCSPLRPSAKLPLSVLPLAPSLAHPAGP